MDVSTQVISEAAFTKWKDDIKDSTPGRDKVICCHISYVSYSSLLR